MARMMSAFMCIRNMWCIYSLIIGLNAKSMDDRVKAKQDLNLLYYSVLVHLSIQYNISNYQNIELCVYEMYYIIPFSSLLAFK